MIKGIEIKENKSRVAIVVVGYNRIDSLKRLLGSLLIAVYPTNDIPLIISIDCSGEEELYHYVEGFDWPFGEKYINIQKERLGLKNHIFQCGDLTAFFKAIILLEDDLFVSPYFYDYVLQCLDAYGEDSLISEISLYKNEYNGYLGLPFSPLHNGNSVFLMQDVSTWGQCWNSRMWIEFKKWFSDHNDDYIQQLPMPDKIKSWTRAWSKYFNAYVVDANKYVVYPYVSLTTNFSDAGEHGSTHNSIVQVNLQQGTMKYIMPPSDKLVRYDIFFNNECLYDWLGKERKEIQLDTYGFLNESHKKYLLTMKELHFPIVSRYALYMRPLELNVKYAIKGSGLFLYKVNEGKYRHSDKHINYSKEVVPYFLQGFNLVLIVKYSISQIWALFKRKLGIQ